MVPAYDYVCVCMHDTMCSARLHYLPATARYNTGTWKLPMILVKYPSALKWCKGRGHHCAFAGNIGR